MVYASEYAIIFNRSNVAPDRVFRQKDKSKTPSKNLGKKVSRLGVREPLQKHI